MVRKTRRHPRSGSQFSGKSSLPSKVENGYEVVFGFHSVESVVRANPHRVIEVLIDARSGRRAREFSRYLDEQGVSYRAASRDDITDELDNAVHQGVMARIKPEPPKDEADLDRMLDNAEGPIFLLILDQIQDPHNLGACIRTADGAGVKGIVVTKNGSCPVNQTVRKVAAGAVDRMPVFYVSNLSRTLDDLKDRGVWITGATDKGERELYDCDLTGNIAIAMGSEGKGLRRLTLEKCDQLAGIPMLGSVSSLNVSVATGVFLFEATRQRRSLR